MENDLQALRSTGVATPPDTPLSSLTTREFLRYAEYYFTMNGTLPPAWQQEMLKRLDQATP